MAPKPANCLDTPPERLRLEYLDAAQLAENPKNWRTHPAAQTDALRDVLTEVGWAGALLYNERTGRLIDGHARRKIAAEQGAAVPVLIGSWSEAEEALILATLDPLGALATPDSGRLDELLKLVTTDSPSIQQMLENLAASSPVLADAPEPGAGGDEFDTTPDDGPCRVQTGDLWVIGGYVAKCPKCQKLTSVEKQQ